VQNKRAKSEHERKPQQGTASDRTTYQPYIIIQKLGGNINSWCDGTNILTGGLVKGTAHCACGRVHVSVVKQPNNCNVGIQLQRREFAHHMNKVDSIISFGIRYYVPW
jgi:hypothetical protein